MKISAEFQRCMPFVLEQECRKKKDGTLDDGYVNDPNDPGGETKYGISKKAHPDVDIKNLTLDGAIHLYYDNYWPLCSALTFPLNVCVLDCAVNQGVKRAAKFLLQSDNDWKKFLELRKMHYVRLYDGPFKKNPDRGKYFRFWMKRLNNLKKFIDEELEE